MQFAWEDVSVTANTPMLLKDFSLDPGWSNRNIIGIVPVSIRGYNTEAFIPAVYRQYSKSYFTSTVTQSYDIAVNVLYK